jgi:hypothetical protein
MGHGWLQKLCIADGRVVNPAVDDGRFWGGHHVLAEVGDIPKTVGDPLDRARRLVDWAWPLHGDARWGKRSRSSVLLAGPSPGSRPRCAFSGRARRRSARSRSCERNQSFAITSTRPRGRRSHTGTSICRSGLHTHTARRRSSSRCPRGIATSRASSPIPCDCESSGRSDPLRDVEVGSDVYSVGCRCAAGRHLPQAIFVVCGHPILAGAQTLTKEIRRRVETLDARD